MVIGVNVISKTAEHFKLVFLFVDIYLFHHVILSTSCTLYFAFQKLL